ncbi:uncharacterized protein LOC114733390 [Neltuma alba]|uniref:uncharacterized protein LOC114733390 n=1 Tax=Neltuma alba TaxID=207710 RepID=UPI0010A34D7A|nr:uncharacterized protein LOC114733390 [Prosopis alba]
MQNPGKDSTTTTKSPSSSHPDQPPPPPGPTQTVAGDVTATGGGGSSVGGIAGSDARIVQVVDPTPVGDGSSVAGAAGGEGGSSAAVVSVEGGVMVVEGGSSVASKPGEKPGKQKRKSSQLSDPPPWPPKCNECGKEFPSWKAAFGHMRAHPERDYRGFFRPPTSSSSSSPTRQRVRLAAGENINTGVEEQGGGQKGGSSGAGGVGFDLNQPTTEEVESSNSEAVQRNQALDSTSLAAERSAAQEEKKVGFDLNELPASEEDDHHQHKP